MDDLLASLDDAEDALAHHTTDVAGNLDDHTADLLSLVEQLGLPPARDATASPVHISPTHTSMSVSNLSASQDSLPPLPPVPGANLSDTSVSNLSSLSALPPSPIPTRNSGSASSSQGVPGTPTSGNRFSQQRTVLNTPIGKITLGEVMGKGTGVMIKGLVDTGEVVAVKRLDLGALPRDALWPLQSAITSLQRLNHSQIIRMLGQCQDSSYLYIIEELAENGSLLELIKEFGYLPEQLVISYLEQILQGLKYLHNEHITHQSLKASNVLVTKTGRIKLSDFSIAAIIHRNIDSVVGSPYWMAPELVEESKHTPETDIWSLGCATLEMLTGKPPFAGLPPMTAMYKIVQEAIPLPTDCSEAMKEFLNQCFCKSPESRPSASTLLGGPLFAKSLALKDADYHSIRQSVVDFHRTLTLKNLKAPLPVSSKTLGTPKSSYKMPALPKYEELVQAREAVATLKAEHSKLQEEFQKLSEENKKLQHDFDTEAGNLQNNKFAAQVLLRKYKEDQKFSKPQKKIFADLEKEFEKSYTLAFPQDNTLLPQKSRHRSKTEEEKEKEKEKEREKEKEKLYKEKEKKPGLFHHLRRKSDSDRIQMQTSPRGTKSSGDLHIGAVLTSAFNNLTEDLKRRD